MSTEEKEKLIEREEVRAACDINTLRLQKTLCDVLIKVEGAEFHAHKSILCGGSPFFRALFTNGWYPPDKHEYTIPDVSAAVMRLIIDNIYQQHIEIMEENVCELLTAADYLAVNNLVNRCSVFLKAQLCVENCLGIWHFSHFHACQQLKKHTFHFILYNFEEIVRVSEEFLGLTVEQLGEIIEHNELNLKQENVVFEAILQWIKHEPQNRKEHMGVLLPKVRLALLTHNYFTNNVRHNTFVAGNAACTLILTRAQMIMFGLNSYQLLSSELRRPRLPSAVLLAIGGWSGRSPCDTIEAYDTRAKCWTKLTCNGDGPRAYHGTVFLNGFVYCIGGFNGENYFSSVSKFDPISKTWAQVGPMNCRRCYVSVCVLDGHIYAMGGFDGLERLNTVERYKPETNQWSIIAPMNIHRSDASATVLDGKVYICGGFDGNECLSTAECYSPQMDEWTFISPMISRRSGLGVTVYDGKVYAVGGFDGTLRLRSAEVYNPRRNSWSNIPDMNNPRSNFGIGVVDDLLFTVGGYNGFNTTSKAECYNNKIDEWSSVKDMEMYRSALSCCVVQGLANMVEYAAPRDVHRRSGGSAGFLTAPAYT